VTGRGTLQDGDLLRIGSTEFTLEFEAATEVVEAEVVEPAGGTGKRSGFLKPWMAAVPVLLLVVVGGLLLFTGDDGPKTVTQLVDEAKPSTLLVKTFDRNEPEATGSAWTYSAKDGFVVTNAHVLNGATRFEVSLEGEPLQRNARAVAVAECEDIALLATPRVKDLRTFPLAGSDEQPAQGDEVVALGYPGNASTADELQVTTGNLSALNIDWDQPADEDIDFAVYPDVHQIDAAINPGNSGGPLMDMDGSLIGMNATVSGGDNQAFAISIDRLQKILPGLADGDSLGWAGFTFTAMSAQTLNSIADDADLVGGWKKAALFVDSVIPGSPAANAGLAQFDVIYAVNGESVNSRSDYCREVSGDTVELEYYSIGSDWANDESVAVKYQ
jgi:S1-C subfamily serine protease